MCWNRRSCQCLEEDKVWKNVDSYCSQGFESCRVKLETINYLAVIVPEATQNVQSEHGKPEKGGEHDHTEFPSDKLPLPLTLITYVFTNGHCAQNEHKEGEQ